MSSSSSASASSAAQQQQEAKTEVAAELCEAIRTDNVNRFCNLLQAKASATSVRQLFTSITEWPSCQVSPLHVAVTTGRHEYILPLKEAGASLDTPAVTSRIGPHTETATHTAVADESWQALKTLIKLRADLTVMGSRPGLSPGTPRDWAEQLTKTEAQRIFSKVDQDNQRIKSSLILMVIIFIVAPITSFLFFSFVIKQ